MGNRVTITIPSHPMYLSVVRAVAMKMAAVSGMTEAECESIRLAIDEACSNVIKYAYKGDTGRKIVVKFRSLKKGFEVLVEDSGEKACPELMNGRDLDELRPGGLGIHLIRRAFDELGFDAKRKKGNRLRLFRNRGGQDGH
ncbi:MAG TPA: ATP-binding protein [Dissulfurispiraceae bacterium]